MRAILSAPGSRGDVNPMVAIGRELRRLGFDVVISLAEPYAEVARKADLQVEPIIDQLRFEQLLANPNVWKPISGPRALLGDVAVEFLRRHDEVIRQHHRPGETVLVSHPLDLASRVFRQCDEETPLASIHLAPSILRTPDDPARLTPYRFEITRPAFAVRAVYWLADHLVVDPLLRRPVNDLLAQHGGRPIRRVLDRWWLSPDRVFAMYPRWYAPATEQFCPRLVHAGFPLSDADDCTIDLPADRPIVFTPGTAQQHCRPFFEAAVDACQSLGRSGWLLSTHAENFPRELPPWIQTRRYVSLHRLLPHCGAIVHHGGIGTTSQSLAAGIPQVVRPLAYDQFDNATRVQRLGCGVWLRRDRHLKSTLGNLLEDPQVRQECQKVARWFSGQSAARVVAKGIHDLLSSFQLRRQG